MQIFEYSFKTGRGEKLADLSILATGQRIGATGENYDTNIINNITDSYGTILTADDFEVDYITCCAGQNQYDGKWDWMIIPNTKIIAKAHKRNTTFFGHVWMTPQNIIDFY